jgi:SAM-dependent methyltransferase
MAPDRSDLLRATSTYYEENANAFDARTCHRDLSAEYREFLALVPPGGRILDAGCGPGRDSAAFAGMGYRVTATDASAAMVALATGRLGFAAQQVSFGDLAYDQEFDGVWACASLLHVAKDEMPGVLVRLHRALEPGGVLYASFKRGRREEFREGRWFNDYEEDTLAGLFLPDRWRLVRVWPTDEVRPEKLVAWVNVLALRASR